MHYIAILSSISPQAVYVKDERFCPRCKESLSQRIQQYSSELQDVAPLREIEISDRLLREQNMAETLPTDVRQQLTRFQACTTVLHT